MTPRHLVFSGIGPFPKKVAIDFDQLGAKGLYLIVGPTGAGKTTIFDAMTYALYGKVPSDRESSIVSSYGSREAPFIEFTFSRGNRSYVVHREPAAPGQAAVPRDRQWLSEVDANGRETRRTTGAREVTDRVKSFIGLDHDQFTKVILLPQGKFQQFLLATTTEKKGLLKVIFGTMVFGNVAEELVGRADALKESVRLARADLEQQWAIVEDTANGLQESLGELPDYRAHTSELIETVSTRSAALTVESREKQEAHGVAKADLKQADRETKRFDTTVRLNVLRKDHKAKASMVETAKRRVDDHLRAAPVAAAGTTRDGLTERAAVAEAAMSMIRRELSKEVERLEVDRQLVSPLNVALASGASTALIREFERLEGVLRATLAEHADLEKIRRVIGSLSADESRLTASEAEESPRLRKLQEELAVISRELTKAREAARAAPKAEKAVEALEVQLVEANVEDATSDAEKASRELDKPNEACRQAEQMLQDARARHLHDIASELAAGLSAGASCPVCGSTDHPRKAKPSGRPVDLEAAERRRDQAVERRTVGQQKLKEAQSALEAARRAHAKLPTKEQQKDLRERWKKLAVESSGEDRLEKATSSKNVVIEKLEGRIRETRETLAGTRAALKGHRARMATLESKTSVVGTRKAIEGSQSVAKSLRSLLGRLDKEAKSANELRGRVKEAADQAGRLLEQSGLESEKAARAALLEDAERNTLQEAAGEATRRESDMEKMVAAIGDEPLPEKRPDIDAMKLRVEIAEAAAREASEVSGAVRAGRTQIERAFKRIQRIGPTLEERAERADTAAWIAKIFHRGEGAGANAVLDLETWVQRTLFEEVCIVANHQMRALSSNRYTLTLDPEEGGIRRRRGGGLDVYVLDAQTAITRPVQSMSGGEQFITSLALALALAEVVQRHAGGIDLPYLFIDEGFGGLDSESLDLAIDVLIQLQASGRSVGVVTHVEQMQRDLPIGIRVNKGATGSTIELPA